MKKKKTHFKLLYAAWDCKEKNEKKKKTPGFWGVTVWYQSVGIRIPRAQWGTVLEHAVDE